MKVGEIGFVIMTADGRFVGRSKRRHVESPFRTWQDAENARIGQINKWNAPNAARAIAGEVIPVKLIPMIEVK